MYTYFLTVIVETEKSCSYYFPPKTLFRTFFCCIVSIPAHPSVMDVNLSIGGGSFFEIPEPLWHWQDSHL